MARKKRKKDPAAVALGRKGGKATARNRTAEQRREAARHAIAARWAKAEKPKG
jgi:RNase P protein component